VVAITRDPVETTSRAATRLGLPFPVLSDPDLALIGSLGLIHPRAGPGGSDVARPATYVIGRDGVVRWMHAATNIRVRPDPADVLAAVR
jgi:peroxiredoxin